MACPTVSGRTGISARGRGLLGALLALIFTLVVCALLSAIPAFADEGDGCTEPQAWTVCGNFAFALPQGATCEALDSTEVDSALQESGSFSGVINQGALCRIDAADEAAVYVYACRALIDADDVAWANSTTDEVALQERGEWFARQLLGSDALLTAGVRYVGCLHYDVKEQPLTFFCFSNYFLRVGCVVGFVPLPSGYVSTIAFAFELSQSEGAMSVVDGVIPSLEVGDGYTTPEMIEAEFEKDYTLSEDVLASSGMTHGDRETGPYKDGYYESYTRDWAGNSPAVCLQVTDGKVAAVEVSDGLAYLGFGTDAIDQLPSAIVAANGIEGVDIVSGATLTSQIILYAAEGCLVQATACPFAEDTCDDFSPQADIDFQTCQGCHDDDLDAWDHAPSKEQATQDWAMDPHNMPVTEVHAGLSITCNDCHVVGKASVMACAQCHNGKVEVPGGWKSPSVHIDATQDHMSAVSLDTCATCHDGTVVRELDMAGVAAQYSWRGQPFDFHDMSATLKSGHTTFLGDFSCQTCHAEQSVAACITCHSGVFTEENLPEGWTIEQSETDAAAEEKAEGAPVSDAAYNDGEYAAEGKGIGGKVPVTVTVKGGKIATVTVGDNSETQGIGSKAIEQLPDAIVKANGTEGVDAVSGATVTSKAIFTAVDEALEQAKGGAAAEQADRAAPAADEKAEDAKADEKSEPAADDKAEQVAPAAEAVALKDGEYTAEGKGIGGTVPVTVEVKDGKIAEVTVGDNSETQGIGSQAIEQLPSAIVTANGTESVDAVSGATVTSKAIFSAVEECLKQAKGDAEVAEQAAPAEDAKADEKAEETTEAEPTAEEKAEEVAPADEAGVLADGTYTASARCSGGIVPVTVTYEDGGVVCIEIENDSALEEDDFKAVLAAIIGCRSQAVKAAVEIDRTAVENAVAAAEFSVDAAIEAASAAEAAAPAAESGTLTDGALADGTYTASGKGYDGEVPVTVTIEGGKIASVTVGYNYATSGIGLMAINQLPSKIVAANGTEGVDAVSGATVTSKAIITAVNSCLKQAAS